VTVTWGARRSQAYHQRLGQDRRVLPLRYRVNGLFNG